MARERGAFTIGLTTDRRLPVARAARIAIAPQTGPEAISGSTRMKAGTAHKMVLNILSTASMVRLGYVYDNWMINVAQSNHKLRQRALRILQQATGIDPLSAERAMRETGRDIRLALVMLKAGVDLDQAKQRLAAANGNVRLAIEATKKQRRSSPRKR